MTTPVLLDTDIGTDIDDAIALAVMLGSPSLRLVGVSTVYVDAPLRARLMRDLLDRAGRRVDVWAGESVPVRAIPELENVGVWEWHEGRGVLYEDVSPEEQEYAEGRRPRARPYDRSTPDGAERLAAAATANGPVAVVCIGPLTNLATALLHHPEIADSISTVTVMGGWIRPDVDEPQVEHNFKADPGAVEVVFRSSLPLTLVTFDVSEACYLHHDRAAAECRRATPLGAALGRLIDVYFQVKHRWRTSMHDPVAVAVTEDPSMGDLPTTDVFVDPTTGGTSLTPFDGSLARKVSLLRDLHIERCESLIYERLAMACSDRGHQ